MVIERSPIGVVFVPSLVLLLGSVGVLVIFPAIALPVGAYIRLQPWHGLTGLTVVYPAGATLIYGMKTSEYVCSTNRSTAKVHNLRVRSADVDPQ